MTGNAHVYIPSSRFTELLDRHRITHTRTPPPHSSLADRAPINRVHNQDSY
ncbi:MAG: hypothetical protein ACXVR9_16880 [Gaiellaceae bacterium]